LVWVETKITDFRLKCCILKEDAKNTFSGRSSQKTGCGLQATYLPSRQVIGVEYLC
jgi:hypothetical protein